MSNNQVSVERLKGRENFTEWKVGAKAYLTSKGYWNCCKVELGSDATSTAKEKDEKAAAELILLLDKSLYSYVDGAESAKAVWDALLGVFEDKGAVRKVALLKQWISLKACECSSMQEYVNKSVSLRQKIKTAGFDISEEIAGSILLCGLGNEYNSLIMGLEGKGNITMDSVKNVLLQNIDFEESESAMSVKKTKFKKKKPVKCYDCGGPHYRRFCKQENKSEKSECVLYSALVTNSQIEDEWYVDSGATKHMTHMNVNMENIRDPIVREVKVANNDRLKINHVGDIKCKSDDHSNILTLKDVQFIPDICVNLLSVSQMVKNGCSVLFDINGCKIFEKNNKLIATGKLINDMFKMNLKLNESACVSAIVENDESVLWHRRLAHANFGTLKKLLNITVKPDMKCVICAQGKQARNPFNDTGKRASKIMELVHSDVCGPMSVRSLGGSRYFVTFIDDYSRKVFVYALKSKGEVFSQFVEFKKLYEKETEKCIKALRSDNGKEYDNNNFKQFFAKHGIKHELTAPYSPQQNGLAERMNRTIIEKVRCMILDAKLSKKFWAEAVCAAVEIINFLPNNPNDRSPNELWSDKKSDIKRFKVFGCGAMVWKPDQKRKKLDAKSFPCIFLRYADNAKAYRLYDMNAKKVIISRDVIFMENENTIIDSNNLYKNSRVYLENDTNESESNDLISHEIPNEEVETVDSEEDENDELTVSNDDENSVSNASVNENENDDTMGEMNENGGELNTTTNVSTNDDFEDANADASNDDLSNDPNFSTRARVNEDADGVVTRGRLRNLLNFHTAFIVNEPISYKHALEDENCDKWKKAMKEEYDSLMQNNTWELVERPPGEKIVDNKWIYKVKFEQKNQPSRFKARLVARGFTQEYGVNYYETFSPVVRFTSIRIILAIAAKMKMHLKQFDVKTAFLNGDLRETVFMEQPIGFGDGSNKVCKLKKSLYGLKQASRCWNEKFSTFIKLFGFKQCNSDPCVYTSKSNGALTIMAIHVDDGLIVGESVNEIKSVIKYLGEKFEIKEMNVGCFLGVEIQKRADNSIFVHQSTYAEKVLSKFNMQNCNPVSTPSDTNQPIGNFDESNASSYPYRELIGSLMYLAVGTRPDIAHAVGIASRYLEKPTVVHEKSAKRILKYLKNTINFGILFHSDGTYQLNAYSDADFAGDIDSRRSTTGYVFIFGGGAISWCSERQKSVSLSTTESEYMAASQCIREMVWINNALQEILNGKLQTINFFMDNQSAIRLIKNPEFHKRSKHIDVRYHFIREKYIENLFILNYISTDDMIADIFTKALSAQKFKELASKLGLKQLQ